MSNGWSKAPADYPALKYRGWSAMLVLALAASTISETRPVAPAAARVLRAGAAPSNIAPPHSTPLGLLAQLQAGLPVAPVVPPPPGGVRASATALQAWEILWATLAERDAGWSRVHAAEALSQLGHGPAVGQRLVAALPAWESSPQRIGAWRVLAAGATSPAERIRWLERITQVAHDPAATDRLQAVESFGKLGERVTGSTLAAVRVYAAAIPAADALFPLWVLHLSGDPVGTRGLLAGLGAADPAVRRRAAFVMRRLSPLPAEMKVGLTHLARTESASSVAFPYVLAAALTHELGREQPGFSWAELERVGAAASGPVRLEIVQTLLSRLEESAMPSWAKTMKAEDSGSRIAGAWAILQIARLSRGPAKHKPPGTNPNERYHENQIVRE